MSKILVVGGGGYIGSHMAKLLLRHGEEVVVCDDLSSGFRDAVAGGTFELGSLADTIFLDGLFSRHRFDAVMHFASFIQVGESVREPAKYYRNNVVNTLNLLDAMAKHGVRHFVFSSTAAVYGEPQTVSLTESHPRNPVNPYGRTKWMVEQILGDYGHAWGLRSVSLRYFNAAGADPDGQLGERHDPETHLVPLVLQAASGRRASIQVFGRDYATPDGTCIRDYIHVADLCDAHLLALKRLLSGWAGGAYNLGNGNGFSVQQVIETARRVTGRAIKVEDASRRPGDPAILVADAGLVRGELGWQPRYGELGIIVDHAWRWEMQKGRRW